MVGNTDIASLSALLDTLCPMHAVLDDTGHILHAGPTLQKLTPDKPLKGRRFLEFVELRRPRIEHSMAGLRRAAGTKLHFRLRRAPFSALKGVLVALDDNLRLGPRGGAIIDLSFGISVVEAVHDFNLTNADFAATDLTVEMLYLVEAKSAAMEASRKLNLRLQGAMIAAEEQAFTDTLTGLKNRRAMEHVLDRLMQTEQDFALMHLDLDYFKTVNDTMGHAAGDHVLQQVARIMIDETRGEDTVARMGGDEFVLVFARLTDRRRVAEIAQRLIGRLEQPILFNKQECRISASIGAALSSDYGTPRLAQIMEDADLALYAAKDRGRGCHVVFKPGLRKTAEPPGR